MKRMRRAGTLAVAAAALIGGAACDDELSPLFEVPGTGVLEGLVFFDANRDGRYDPSDGDYVIPDVQVRLLQRGTGQVLAGAEGRTSTSGRFALSGIAVGSHDLQIDTAGVGSAVSFCQNPIPVTVFLRETQFQPVAARGGCVITIAEAEALPAEAPATVRGVVVAAPGQIIAGRMYVQDNTGGIRIDNAALGDRTINVGDVVEVSGTRAFNEQETVINAGRVVDHVPGTTAPTPAATTTAAITAAGPEVTNPLQGTLVVVRKAQLTTIWGNNTGSSRNAFIDDGTGPTTIRIDTGVLFTATAAEVIPRLSEVMGLNKCYDVVGIATSFRAGAQIFPRTLNDITEVPCT